MEQTTEVIFTDLLTEMKAKQEEVAAKMDDKKRR
jgi:hypothetical protein